MSCGYGSQDDQHVGAGLNGVTVDVDASLELNLVPSS